jgi:hypothetical protein
VKKETKKEKKKVTKQVRRKENQNEGVEVEEGVSTDVVRSVSIRLAGYWQN